MAKERWFTGFEDANGYDLSAGSTLIISDAKWPARTGDFFVSQYQPQGTTTLQNTRTLVNVYTCAASGDVVVARMQVAFRIRQLTNANQTALWGFSLGTTVAPNQAAGVLLNTNGTLSINSTNGGVVNGAFVAQLGKWYVGRLHFQYQRNDAGTDPYQVILQIFDGDTMDASPAPAPLATIQQVSAFNLGGFALNGIPCLGANVVRMGIYDFDDWWISVASGADSGTPDLNWPGGSRVQRVPITSQVVGGFAGSYLLAIDTPNSALAGNEQTTAAPGAQSTFQHPSAVELGLIPVGQDASGSGGTPSEPFTGLPMPEGLGTNAGVYFGNAQDLSLPLPIINSFTLTPGAGQFTNGVWIRAFTIEWRSQSGGGMVAFGGPLTTARFLSANAAPNFLATILVSFGPGTPTDRFLDPANPGTSAYRRYGIGLLVTNGSNASGLMNPFTNQANLPGPQTNTTNLQAYGGPDAIDAGPWTPIVALYSAITPNGTLPPYANTNPGARPEQVTFLLSSPRPSGTGGSPTSTNLFGNIFQPPAQVDDSDKPVAAAIKVVAAMQHAAGTSNDAILIGGTSFPTSVSTTFGQGVPGFQQFAIDWTERDAAAFDALTFGAAAGAGLATTLRLGQCIAEVLTAGPCTKRNTGFGQYQQQCGIYASNAGIQKIALPFRPTVVFVKRIGLAATFGAVKAWWMGGTTSWVIDGVRTSVSIMELQDDGFLIGPDASANGAAATYAYVAMRDGQEDTINDAYVIAGSYQRQSSLDPDQVVEMPVPALFAASWTPDVIYLLGTGGTILKTPDMAAPNSDAFAGTGLTAQGVTAVGDKTFTTGTTAAQPGQTPFFAMRFDAAGLLATLFQYGSFAGTGGTLVIPTNFRGEVIVLDHPAAAYFGRFRSDLGNAGNNSVPWPGGNVTTTDITAIGNADFTVGSGASVVGQTSYWTAWKRDGSIGNTGSSDIPPPDDEPDPTNPPTGTICGGGGLPLYPPNDNGNGCVQC